MWKMQKSRKAENIARIARIAKIAFEKSNFAIRAVCNLSIAWPQKTTKIDLLKSSFANFAARF